VLVRWPEETQQTHPSQIKPSGGRRESLTVPKQVLVGSPDCTRQFFYCGRGGIR
jgi:hypothetical protein